MHQRLDSRLIDLAFGAPSEDGHATGRRRGDGPPVEALLRAAIAVSTESAGTPLVLAVSGGRDSMALLHAMARWARPSIAAVATFDHGTGGAATAAASLVASEARRLGLTVVRERARGLAPTEQAWRASRWEFLRRVSRAFDARIATAHTRDDQLETIVMRILRGSGTRGLAALAAATNILRPWLPVTRQEITTWIEDNRIEYIDDPANEDRRYLRVRVRLDLLPALEAAHPGFAEEMLTIGEQAAAWRRDVDALLDETDLIVKASPEQLRVRASLFDEYDDDVRAIFWQALFGRIGVALDARGTRELIRFSKTQRRGAELQLAGGARAYTTRGDGETVFDLRRPSPMSHFRRPAAWTGSASQLPRRLGAWRFHRIEAPADESHDPHVMSFPTDSHVTIRSWRAGDRLQAGPKSARRRVARYFVEAGVAAPDRLGWPVVLLEGGEDVVWVPGVCRSSAAPFRPGRSDLIWYRSEREHG